MEQFIKLRNAGTCLRVGDKCFTSWLLEGYKWVTSVLPVGDKCGYEWIMQSCIITTPPPYGVKGHFPKNCALKTSALSLFAFLGFLVVGYE